MSESGHLLRVERANESLNVPPSLSGHHRQRYLELTDAQKRVYRYWWFVCGRPGWACLEKALASGDGEGQFLCVFPELGEVPL